MDSFELNKIAGAVLGTCLFAVGLGILGEMAFEPERPEKPGYEIAVAEPQAGQGGQAAEQVEPIAARLAKADPAKGQNGAKPCMACHTFEKGGANKVGPNLYGVVGGPVAHKGDFAYSDDFKKLHAQGATWSYEALDKFLANPKADIPGTKMTFAGIQKPDQRADVVAYLRSLSDSPPPLPTPEAAAQPQPPAGGQPAGGGQPAAGAQPAAGGQPAAGAQPGSGGQGAGSGQAPTPQQTSPAQVPPNPSAGTTAPVGATPQAPAQQPSPQHDAPAAAVGTQSPGGGEATRSAVPPSALSPADQSRTMPPSGSAGTPGSPQPAAKSP